MNWIFRWISAGPDLGPWEQRPFSPGAEDGPRPRDHQDRHERVVGFEAPGAPEADGVARRVADAILRFDVFPPSLLLSVLRRTPVEVGDAIGLRYPFVPGIDLFFAARVIDRIEDTANGLWRSGFTYRTLDGHPACGEETFVVEKNLATGRVIAALRSWSRAGLWIATLAYPLMRWLQVRAAEAALDHLQSIATRAANAAAGLIATPPATARQSVRSDFLLGVGLW